MIQFHTYSLTLSSGNDFQYVCNSNDKQTVLRFIDLFLGNDLIWFLQYGDLHVTKRLLDKHEIINFLKSDK